MVEVDGLCSERDGEVAKGEECGRCAGSSHLHLVEVSAGLTRRRELMSSLLPSSRFEQDMTWLRAGIASRTAIDIALHRVGLLAAAREGLPPAMLKSLLRTWLLCFVIDRTLSIQLGKPDGNQWEPEAAKYVEYLRSPSGTERNVEAPSRDDIWVAALGVGPKSYFSS